MRCLAWVRGLRLLFRPLGRGIEMFVFEITNLFRQYCDEPDATWLTTTDVSNYLATGYREFQWAVSDLAPYTYAVDVSIPATAATSYDLADPANAVRILGNNLSAGVRRMMQLIEIRSPAGSPPNDLIWRSVNSMRGLQGVYRSYYLQGSTLNFSYAPIARLPSPTYRRAQLTGQTRQRVRGLSTLMIWPCFTTSSRSLPTSNMPSEILT